MITFKKYKKFCLIKSKRIVSLMIKNIYYCYDMATVELE